MKMTTASAFLFLFALCCSINSSAQLRLPAKTNSDVKQALEKVITDFPKNFSTLRGDVLTDNPQTVEYVSLLEFKSAEQNTITQYSGKQPVYSWRAQMLTTDDYETANKKYKTLYKDLKNMSLTLNRDYTYGLSGEFNALDESLGFATSEFHLTPSASNLPKVKVELAVQYEFPEWKVYLTVFQKEREDDERGKIKE